MVAAEVAAGRMLWSGSAQSGVTAISWGQFTSAVSNDGTNPGGYAVNQLAPYSYMLAHAVVVGDPTSLFASPTGDSEATHTSTATWNAPATGPTPASYTVLWYQNGALKQTATGVVTTNHTSSGFEYSIGDTVDVTVQSVYGAGSSPGVSYSFTY